MTVPLPAEDIWRPILERSLAEDLDEAGDITTRAVVPPTAVATAHVVSREPGVVAGLPIALTTFEMLDPGIGLDTNAGEGKRVEASDVLAVVTGPAAPILSAERVALNLLGRLCGIATRTAQAVDAVSHTDCKVMATRKTTPGLRYLEKYAVEVGGGMPHRQGLYDAVLIKDNHLLVAGSIRSAVEAAQAAGVPGPIEVEVTSLEGLDEAIDAGAEIVLLDNMDPPAVASAVEVTAGRVILEASGGITPETIVAYAETGVDRVSLGWLTHSVPSLDVALDFQPG